MADGNGIHKLNKDTKVWETVADGSLTSLIMPDLFNDNIFENKNNDYYISYRDSKNNFSIMKYSYNKDVSTKPETQLSIYSLKENFVFEESIVEYQRKHPDVKVNLNIQ